MTEQLQKAYDAGFSKVAEDAGLDPALLKKIAQQAASENTNFLQRLSERLNPIKGRLNTAVSTARTMTPAEYGDLGNYIGSNVTERISTGMRNNENNKKRILNFLNTKGNAFISGLTNGYNQVKKTPYNPATDESFGNIGVTYGRKLDGFGSNMVHDFNLNGWPLKADGTPRNESEYRKYRAYTDR